MEVTIHSGGGVVGPMQLGPVDTETVEDRELGLRIETLVRQAFANASAPASVPPFPHPNEAWTDVEVSDRVRAERLPEGSAGQVADLLRQTGLEWHRPLRSSGVSPIFRHWVHSREDDEDGVRVYRPHDFNFPLSRGREGLEIEASGALTRYAIGPNDAPMKVSGRWTMIGLQLDFADETGPTTLDVLSYDDDVLRVRQVPEVDLENPCSGWTAQLLTESSGMTALRVQGTCTYFPGFSVFLSRHDPQGSDPRELLLDLTVVTPPPPWSGPSTVSVVYTLESPQSYDRVTLLPAGTSIPVERAV